MRGRYKSCRGLLTLACLLVVLVGGPLSAQSPGGPPDRRARPSMEAPTLEGGGAPPPSHGTADVKNFGAQGNGVTDDTLAIQAAIDSLTTTGGIVHFPVGQYYVAGQIVLPNDGAPFNTAQPAFIFEGSGGLFDGRNGAPNGGTVLDLRYAGGPKIATYGLGLLEMRGITFADFGSDSAPFIFTSNTTLHIHDCGFFTHKVGELADNDAILLGGTDDAGVGGPGANAPFQGYGTVIRDNYFGGTRRAVYGRVYANAVVVEANTIWRNSGSNLPGGAAIELDGDPEGLADQSNGGWYVAGNLIEMEHYAYGIKCANSQRSVFIGNNFYDPSEQFTVASYGFDPSGKLNYVVAGFHEDNYPFVEDLAVGFDRSTVIDFHQSRESQFAQKARFFHDVFLEPNASSASPYGPRLVTSTGAQLTYQMFDDSGMRLWYTPAGGSPVQLWQLKDFGGGVIIQELQGTDARIRNIHGSLKLQSDVGRAVEIGDVMGTGIRIEGGDVVLPGGARILSGAGAPAVSAANGSMYLRTDGGAGSTMYVREAGVWVAK